MLNREWTWLPVRPGVLALSGTPYRVHADPLDLKFPWQVFKDDGYLANRRNLAIAKYDCQHRAGQLIEAGVIEDPRA